MLLENAIENNEYLQKWLWKFSINKSIRCFNKSKKYIDNYRKYVYNENIKEMKYV